MTRGTREALTAALREERNAAAVLQAIRREADLLGPVRLMEVCGTHTVAIRRSGIPSLLPQNITLLSGPGCPVCVTPNRVVDHVVALARHSRITIATFGDMVRVPGSTSSLALERSRGADVRVVYSPLDAVRLAQNSTDCEVVFLGVGFETTAPTVAIALERASKCAQNFSVLSAHKLVPPALTALSEMPGFAVNGLICPGHVSAIIGSSAYVPLARERGIPCVVAGFEPVDVLLSILMLLKQLREQRAEVEVEYKTAVRAEGNKKALEAMERVFEIEDSAWRELGVIKASGLRLGRSFEHMDADRRFEVEIEPELHHPGCLCGKVLTGTVRPPECAMFGERCTPATPLGPCMVSSEGTCAAYYRYGAER